ncbi:Serine/threonine-protein phosphatase 7 long form-like [Vitis vinifera]|uniref:Serine/threonine-protein phosphatase 7 long form-like n=1 Tax=Vitis vinifera TaxID=29760 RepID=A0A438GGR9_VITVI|nr:Serine/threonine-protein phosphatase 7 long form-like [Vitis vinifera]
MIDSTVEVLCYWNGTILRTKTDLRYVGNNVEIEPIDVPIHTTFVELLKMIYDIIGVDRDYQLVLKCRHPTEINKFQPLVVRNDRTDACMLLVPSKYGMSSVQLFIEQTPNHYHLSNEMGHLTRLSTGDTNVDDENERDEEDDRDDEIDTDEIHLPNDDENCCQTENIDLVMVQQVVECESTRFVNLEVGDRSNNPEVEFEVENISLVASPHDLQHAVKMFFIKAHQEFTVYRSTASVLVLQCKKTPECQWRLRAMTVKDTEMTITVAAIQVVVAEQFGYQISYQKAMKAKRKVMTRLFGDWYKSYAELPRFFLAWSSQILDALWFAHCRPVLSIDGTHLYGKYKGTLLIAMGCDVAVNETYSGWTQPSCHRFCMFHLASNFNTKFKDKTLKDLMCRAAMESKVKKFISHMDTIGWINAEARNWLEQIPLEKWALSYDGGRRYGIMTTNTSEVFNGVLQGARNLPITALVQLTFYRVNSYLTVRREHGASRLTSGEEFTPHIDAKIKAKVVKAGAHEVLLYDHVAGCFHVKTRHFVGSSNRKPRTYHVTLQTGSCTCNKTLLLRFPCLHILATCHCRAIDFRQFVQDSMKRLTSGRPKSSRLHNEMDARETKTPQTCGLYMDTLLFCARPNLEDTSVLTLQHRHRSSTIRVNPDMGFYVFHRVGHVKVDWPFITALVERWRPEMHTFHMPVGEMTITLQDVAILFGLRVHGHPVTGSIDIDWHALWEELLGVRSIETDIRGASLTIRFITTHFSRFPPGVVDEVTLQRHARAYLLLLVSGSLFIDKKGVYIQLAILPMLRDFGETAQYSWGSATLAHLYRELCRASLDSAESIAGPLHLLQEQLHVGHPSRSLPHAPVLVDERFPPDALRNDILALLPDICLDDQDIWRTMSPLMFFDIVEWHRPERVLRQFELIQGHALEDSDTDVCRTDIVDIIRMATDVMCIIREDYRLPHVEHGGDRSPTQSTVAQPPLVRVQSSISSDVPSVQHPTSSDPPSAQPLTSSDPPSVQPPTSLDLPPLQPPTSSDPPLVQIDTSTQLDLPPAIPRGRRGLRRPRLLPPTPPLFPALTPSQTYVLHVSHAVPAIVREKRPKKKRVPITHRFSPCGGM